MIVALWMTPDPAGIAPGATVAAAARTMRERGVRRLLVTEPAHDAGARLVGIVTAGDVARAFPPDLNPAATYTDDAVPTRVATIMTRDPRTVTPNTSIVEAAQLMRRLKIGALPVVVAGRPTGIVTESDVFTAFAELGTAVAGLHVTFELAEDEDVTAAMTELCRRHGARLTSVLSFAHVDRRAGTSRRFGVAHVAAPAPEPLVDAVWQSGHRVVAVVRDARDVGRS